MVALPARLCQRTARAFAGRVGWIMEGRVASTMPSGNPRRGFPTKSLPPEAFSTFLRLLEANKTLGRWSHLPVRSAQGVCHRQTAPYNPQAF